MNRAKTELILTAALCLVMVTLPVQAQETISGPLWGDLGPGTYLVEGECEIPSGATLTIAPGTEFLFLGNYAWQISGTLIAEGTAIDSIVFTRYDQTQATRWGGLRFLLGAPDDSRIAYCVIDNCMNLWYNGGGIYTEGVSFQVRNSTISNCQGADGGAFNGELGADVDFIECAITDNTASSGAGLNYNMGTSGEVRDCIITGNYSSGT